MQRKRISFIVVISIIFLLSSCDISTLLENFKGNAYEDVFDLDLVGEQAQEAIDSVVESSEPENASEDTAIDSTDESNKKVKVDGVSSVETPKGVAPPEDIPAEDVDDTGDLSDGEVAIVNGQVPTLPKQDEEEKDKLKKAVAQALAGEGEDDFVEGLKEEADDDQVFAAHNTKIIVDSVLARLRNIIDANTTLSDGVKDAILNFVDKLQFNLPPNPTKADILNVQLANNIANSMINVLNIMAGDGDIDSTLGDPLSDDEAVIEALRKLASDAGLLIKVSKAQGSTSALINSIDVNGLFSAFNDSTRTLPPPEDPSDSSIGIPDDTIELFNKFKNTINILLKDILGVDIEAETPTMDYDAFLAAIDAYEGQMMAFETFISAAKIGSYTYNSVSADERSQFCGVTGVLNYTIASVLVNLEDTFDQIESLLADPSYNTVESIVNALLASNEHLINPSDGYTAGMEAILPADFSTLETIFSDESQILDELGLEEVATEYLENAILLAELGTPDGDENLLLDMLNDINLPTSSSSSE